MDLLSGWSGNDRRLFDQEWYHGMLPRTEITQLLTEQGDWLVRGTERNGVFRIVLSVWWNKQCKHIIFRKEKDGYSMPGNKRFKGVVELVDYYRNSGESLNDDGINLRGKPQSRKKWMIPSRDVTLDSKIGEGAFGEVYIGKLKFRSSNIPVAIKTCKKAMTADERDEFLKEAKLMIYYRHRNVVQFFGVAADVPPLMLIMENCPNGGLDKYLQRNNVPIEQKVKFCMEGAGGMEYLAVKKNCVHRDLAARNCLIGPRGEIKIADFGLSRTGAYQLGDMKNTKLPIKWAAPESLADGKFSTASDIWSFGILMWEIFADGQIPWPNKTNREAYVAMRSGETMDMPEGVPVPDGVRDLMIACWALVPEQRPDFTTVKNKLEKEHSLFIPPAPTHHTQATHHRKSHM